MAPWEPVLFEDPSCHFAADTTYRSVLSVVRAEFGDRKDLPQVVQSSPPLILCAPLSSHPPRSFTFSDRELKYKRL